MSRAKQGLAFSGVPSLQSNTHHQQSLLYFGRPLLLVIQTRQLRSGWHWLWPAHAVDVHRNAYRPTFVVSPIAAQSLFQPASCNVTISQYGSLKELLIALLSWVDWLICSVHRYHQDLEPRVCSNKPALRIETGQANKLVNLVAFLRTGHKLLSTDPSVAYHYVHEPV